MQSQAPKGGTGDLEGPAPAVHGVASSAHGARVEHAPLFDEPVARPLGLPDLAPPTLMLLAPEPAPAVVAPSPPGYWKRLAFVVPGLLALALAGGLAIGRAALGSRHARSVPAAAVDPVAPRATGPGSAARARLAPGSPEADPMIFDLGAGGAAARRARLATRPRPVEPSAVAPTPVLPPTPAAPSLAQLMARRQMAWHSLERSGLLQRCWSQLLLRAPATSSRSLHVAVVADGQGRLTARTTDADAEPSLVRCIEMGSRTLPVIGPGVDVEAGGAIGLDRGAF